MFNRAKKNPESSEATYIVWVDSVAKAPYNVVGEIQEVLNFVHEIWSSSDEMVNEIKMSRAVENVDDDS